MSYPSFLIFICTQVFKEGIYFDIRTRSLHNPVTRSVFKFRLTSRVFRFSRPTPQIVFFQFFSRFAISPEAQQGYRPAPRVFSDFFVTSSRFFVFFAPFFLLPSFLSLFRFLRSPCWRHQLSSLAANRMGRTWAKSSMSSTTASSASWAE